MKQFTTHPFLDAGDKFQHNPALIFGKTILNYAELHSMALRIIQQLVQRRVKPGDTVILDELPQADMFISIWACLIGGFIAFPVNTRFPESVLLPLIQGVNPSLIISSRTIIPELCVSFDELLAHKNSRKPLISKELDLEAAATLIMTSGSAGSCKIVQHSHKNHIYSAQGSNQNIPLEALDKWLLTLPLYHVGGLSILFRAALAGAAVVIPDFRDELLKTLNDHRITHISLVATQLRRLMAESTAARTLKGMQAILLGGSAFPEPLIRSALEQNLPIHVSYGSTEMASQITTTAASDRSATLTNSGRLLNGRDLIISQEGEILVQGDTLADGYMQGSVMIDLRDADGWFHTGDVGYVDVTGALTVTGRLDNQFISGGENVQPENIESALCKISGITQAIVLPQADSEFGYRPVAYLQLESPQPSLQMIATKLKKSLPSFMIPTVFFQLPQELLTGHLKISRLELSEYLIAGNKHLHSLT